MQYKGKVYETESFIIETDDLNSEVYTNFGQSEMIDFYLHYQDKIYDGCSFTLKGIHYYLNECCTYLDNGETKKHHHFWHKNMIIINDFSIECLIEVINEIINDETVSSNEVFTIVTKHQYSSDSF